MNQKVTFFYGVLGSTLLMVLPVVLSTLVLIKSFNILILVGLIISILLIPYWIFLIQEFYRDYKRFSV